MRRLLLVAAVAACAVAGCGGSSPKGPTALVFVSVKDGDYAIFGADANGSHAQRLTKEKGDPSTPSGLFFQVQPAWSPDGKQIAFVSAREGTPHVYVMDADGTGTRRLTDSDQEDDHPTWSSDGTRIAFRGKVRSSRCLRRAAPPCVGRGLGSAQTRPARPTAG